MNAIHLLNSLSVFEGEGEKRRMNIQETDALMKFHNHYQLF